MFLITLLTTIINFLASNPTASFIDSIFVHFDKGVYQLVSSTFTLFIIMCQLNLNVIYSMASSLVDRLKALIIVFIIFKVGVSLIKYMLAPEKAAEASKKLLINLLVCAALLVSCNFVFSVINELSMMIVGKPSTYHYTTLKQIANVTDDSDDGLIMRIFFGTDSKVTEINNTQSIGDNLAVNTLCATFPDMNSKGLTCSNLKTAISDGGKVNFKKLDNVISKIGKTVDAHPVIALIVGLYMVYSVIKASIEIGVRMFKLMLLQLVAPIAIISVASEEGTKAKPFANFIKLYIQVFISAFTRIIGILLVTVFVSKIFSQLDTIIGDVTSQASSDYSLWILIICIVAGYRFAGEIPKMIDKIFDTKLGDSTDKGFTKFLGSLVAMPVLGVTGAIGGAIGAETISSGVYGAGAGFLGGLAAGFSGNTIPDKIKAAQKNQEKINTVQGGMNAAGGFVPWFEGRVIEGKGWQDRQVKAMEKQSTGWDEVATAIDDYDKARTDSIANLEVGNDFKADHFDSADVSKVKYGDNKDSFVSSLVNKDKYVRAAEAAYQASKTDANKAAYDRAVVAAEDELKTMWDNKRNSVGESDEAKRARNIVETNSRKLGHALSIDQAEVKNNTKKVENGVDNSIKAQAKGYALEAKHDLDDFKKRGAYDATHTGGK